MADEQPAKASTPAPPEMSWRGPKPEAPDRQTQARRRSRWTTLLSAILLALVSALVVWVVYIVGTFPKSAYLLTLQIGAYNDPIFPVVPFARQDSERLERCFTNHFAPETKTLKLLTRELHNLASRPEPTVVVHITALALVRGGEVYLLPTDADPREERTWLKVGDVVASVGRCPARKLLILDLAHPLADPRLGVLEDRVADALVDYFTRHPPGFFVLCPCRGGETSLTSPVLQSSVLTYYLELGLLGEADGAGPKGKKDNSVTAHELCAYVEDRVQYWAQVTRGQPQQPILFHGETPDFPLLSLRRDPTWEMPTTSAEPWPDALRKQWQQCDDWIDRRRYVSSPPLFHKQLTEALRQEQRWQGGAPLDRPPPAAEDREDAVAPLPTISLAVALRNAKTDANLVTAVRRLLVEAAADKNDAAKQDKGEALAKVRLGLEARFKDVEFRQQAWAMTDALSSLPVWEPGQIRLVVEILQPRLPGHDLVETLYLQEIADFAERVRKEGRKWRGDVVPLVFKAMRARETMFAALSEDTSLSSWVATLVKNEADAERRMGELGLLFRDPKYRMEAETFLESAAKKYLVAAERLRTLLQCRQALEDAQALLPGYGPLLSEGLIRDHLAEAQWDDALDCSAKLAAFFAAGDRQADAIEAKMAELKQRRDLLRKSMDKLKATLDARLSEVKLGDGADTLDQILSLLKCPLLKTADRARLHERAAEIARKLQERAEQAKSRAAILPRSSGWSGSSQALLRARLTRDLLRQEGTVNLDVLEQALQPNASGKEDLEAVEAALRQVFAARPGEPAAPPRLNDQARQRFLVWLTDNYVAEGKHWLRDRTPAQAGLKGPELSTLYLRTAGQIAAQN